MVSTKSCKACWSILLGIGLTFTAIAEESPPLAEVRIDESMVPAALTFHPRGKQPVSETHPLTETTFSKEAGWTQFPQWGEGWTARPMAKGTVTTDGIVLLATTWSETSSFGPWYRPEHRQTLRRLLAEGWVPIGRLTKANEPGKGYYAVLRREMKAGDEINVRTLRYYPPLLVSIPADRAAMVARIKPVGVRDLVTANKHGKFPGTNGPPVLTTDRSTAAFHCYEYDHEYGVGRGALVNEIARQAVIMAARDGGLATRDESLREPLVAAAGSEPTVPSLDLMVAVGEHGWLGLTLMHREEKARNVLFDEVIEIGNESMWQLHHTLAKCEAFTREALHEAFERSGLYDYHRPRTDYPRPGPDDVDLSPELQEQLLRFNAAEQFLAVRRIHELIKEHGETRWLLAGLSRGYANLGSLTSHHWARASKVYSARGLLYAERLRVVDRSGPWSRWHRAYAFALAGHQGLALRELELADASLKERPNPSLSEPAYITALRAFLDFDREKLAELSADVAVASLARYLDFLSVEVGVAQTTVVAAAEPSVDAQPANHHILMMLSRYGSQLHHVSQLSAQRFPSELYAQVRRAQPLPQGLMLPEPPNAVSADDANELATRATLLDTLVESAEAADRAEPSLAALARLIEDQTERQAWHRRRARAQTGIGSSAETIAIYDPVVKRHPFGLAHGLYSGDKTDRGAAAHKLAENFDSRFVVQDMTTIRDHFRAYSDGASEKLRPNLTMAVWLKLDPVLRDGYFKTRETEGFNAMTRRNAANRLLTVAPNMPATPLVNLWHNWQKAEELTAAWEERFQNESTVLQALTHTYRQSDRHDDALRTGRRVVVVDPNLWTYRTLAWVHFERAGQRTGAEAETERRACIAAYQEALEQTPHPELSQAEVRAELAGVLLQWDRHEEALYHAEEAAKSGHPAAYRKLADCLAALERWDEAEEAAQVASKSRDYAMTWLHWCVYHGRGELHAAAYALKEHLDTHYGELRNERSDEWRLNYYYLTGQIDEVLKTLRGQYARGGGTAHALLIAMIAEDRGDQATANDYFRRARTSTYTDAGQADGRMRFIGQRVHLGRLADLILSTPQGELPDAAEMNKIIADAPTDRRRSSLYYFAGRLLSRRGHEEAAVAYLRQAAAGENYLPYVVFARHELRKQGLPLVAKAASD